MGIVLYSFNYFFVYFGDIIPDIYNDFKDDFENRKALKTMSIILDTILGLALIYVIYLMIHKIHK